MTLFSKACMQPSGWMDPWAQEQRRMQTRAAAEYEELYHLYLKGCLDESHFRKRRGFYGVHTRADAGGVMVRAMVPLGRLTCVQLRAAADLAERFTPHRHFHLTPRQNLQYYDVPL